MIDKKEQGWGLANYSATVKVVVREGGYETELQFRITQSKIDFHASHWEVVIPGTRHRLILCGRYCAGWDPEAGTYMYPARVKFQEMSTRYCYIRKAEPDTVRGHGYEYTGTIDDVEVTVLRF